MMSNHIIVHIANNDNPLLTNCGHRKINEHDKQPKYILDFDLHSDPQKIKQALKTLNWVPEYNKPNPIKFCKLCFLYRNFNGLRLLANLLKQVPIHLQDYQGQPLCKHGINYPIVHTHEALYVNVACQVSLNVFCQDCVNSKQFGLDLLNYENVKDRISYSDNLIIHAIKFYPVFLAEE